MPRTEVIIMPIRSALLSVLLVASCSDLEQESRFSPITPIVTPVFLTYGEGKFEHLGNYPPDPGTDNYKFSNGSKALFAAVGTLGQAEVGHTGQRMLKLRDDSGQALEPPAHVADHNSARCSTNNANVLGLQHDQVVVPRGNAQLLLDSTDAGGRCNDPGGGGLEIVDVSRIGADDDSPPSATDVVHIVRLAGLTHTVTADPRRPWVIYNSTSDTRNWIDVLDIRSCLYRGNMALEKSLSQKRSDCRPTVHRIRFPAGWPGGQITRNGCHDITIRDNQLYCAALDATLILDVSDLVRGNGSIDAPQLSCTLQVGAHGMITDCSAPQEIPTAGGWRFVANITHPGGLHTSTAPAHQEIAISHEAVSPDGMSLFVTDERGGGALPPGASCAPGVDNPFGHGGLHVFDLTRIQNGTVPRALMRPASPGATPRRAIWRSKNLIAAPDFCTIHRIELLPDENRIIVAYYSQGVKILDYFVDDDGFWSFRETAAIVLPGANTWTATPYHIVTSTDRQERTYYILASDIDRGIDIIKWTGAPNFPPKPREPNPDIEEPLPIPSPGL